MTDLRGPYRVVNDALLRKKAADSEVREFYVAMLACRTYEEYPASVGSKTVYKTNFKANPVTGRGEILYCRRNGWIKDA
jgi:hypothetical protein